ncbi:cold shock domain-containing protein [Parahaliea mediterranea]|uniref:Cold shock domain-containing protein n=1 Tax=Parahaliea mediterranea TaxID=651086 RepID=A0A939DF17_9GAMM|nr:cold shock domain-containing protein [Parahaliea mediterranea]
MNLTGKLVTSLVIAAVASTIATLLQGGAIPDIPLVICFAVATLATALLVSPPTRASAAAPSPAASRPSNKGESESGRAQGKVKWFNVSKGFGFIVKDDGDEIFVHFRSIRGDGRRSLRDGQRVAFDVANSTKGPQAEDVVVLD